MNWKCHLLAPALGDRHTDKQTDSVLLFVRRAYAANEIAFKRHRLL
jgi:hypothetical protein